MREVLYITTWRKLYTSVKFFICSSWKPVRTIHNWKEKTPTIVSFWCAAPKTHYLFSVEMDVKHCPCYKSNVNVYQKITCSVVEYVFTSSWSRPAVENQKIKCNEPMGYTPISYVIGKRNYGTLRIMMP